MHWCSVRYYSVLYCTQCTGLYSVNCTVAVPVWKLFTSGWQSECKPWKPKLKDKNREHMFSGGITCLAKMLCKASKKRIVITFLPRCANHYVQKWLNWKSFVFQAVSSRFVKLITIIPYDFFRCFETITNHYSNQCAYLE